MLQLTSQFGYKLRPYINSLIDSLWLPLFTSRLIIIHNRSNTPLRYINHSPIRHSSIFQWVQCGTGSHCTPSCCGIRLLLNSWSILIDNEKPKSKSQDRNAGTVKSRCKSNWFNMRAGQSRHQKGTEGRQLSKGHRRSAGPHWHSHCICGTSNCAICQVQHALNHRERERERLSPSIRQSVSQACSQLYNNWRRVRDDIY